MACFNGSRVVAKLASTARSAAHSCRNTSLVSDFAVGNAGRSVPCGRPVSSPFNSAPSPSLSNRRLSSYLMRVPKEMACIQSLLPLYSVTASSRLVSLLSINAGTTPSNLQGTLIRMSPDR